MLHGVSPGREILCANQSFETGSKSGRDWHCTFVLLVALLAFPITRGANFSDESDNALSIDDWLKGSILTDAFRNA
jgi:hypothetical protein